VKGTFELATNAAVRSPPTLLMHFRLRTTSRVAHFTIVQDLLAEYFKEGGDSNLHVVDLEINIEDNEDVATWTSKAAERVHQITMRKREQVVVFVTTHSDPDRGLRGETFGPKVVSTQMRILAQYQLAR
jgi:hypothetical protein